MRNAAANARAQAVLGSRAPLPHLNNDAPDLPTTVDDFQQSDFYAWLTTTFGANTLRSFEVWTDEAPAMNS